MQVAGGRCSSEDAVTQGALSDWTYTLCRIVCVRHKVLPALDWWWYQLLTIKTIFSILPIACLAWKLEKMTISYPHTIYTTVCQGVFSVAKCSLSDPFVRLVHTLRAISASGLHLDDPIVWRSARAGTPCAHVSPTLGGIFYMQQQQ